MAVQIIEENRKPSTAEKFNKAFGALLQGGQQIMDQQAQKKALMGENQAIQELTGKNLSGIQDPKIRQQAVQIALQGQNQQEKFNQESGKNEEYNKNITEAIHRLTGQDLSGLPPDMQKIYLDKIARSPNHDKLKDLFIKQGASEDDAELYSYLTTGGQTEFVKKLMEERKRGGQGIINQEDQIPSPKELEKPISVEKKFDNELSEYLSMQDEGLLPSEKIARGKERYDTGLKQYQESGNKLRSLARDKEGLDILEGLNNSKKLPKDLARLNVDDEGNLRLPFATNPETERYVKTLNEFSKGAKDTFGSRVTNFDLQQYLRRFPTLLNSEEGRRQLLDQMKIVNQINAVYYKNLKDVYDKAGGVRNIDTDAAERFAEKKSDKKINELAEKFKEIGQFSSKPNASEFKGKRIRDKDTGEILISNGTDWIPAE